ncbi:MAG: aldehyde dehydrogenase family protein [Polyangiaceae bacterium]
MTTSASTSKVTYSSTSVDMTDFHRRFDAAIADVKSRAGQEHPLYINGEAVSSPLPPIVDLAPADNSLVLGKFASASAALVEQAISGARAAQKGWARTPWKERVAVLRKAAEIIRERKYEISAVMSLEVGKSRMESMGDTEESADLIDYYAGIYEEAAGYDKPMGRLTPNENTRTILRPFGVFACIAPFNFPMALSTGMSSAALMTGNTVVYKPAQDTPWTGLLLREVYAAAGVPAGVFQYVSGLASNMGDALWKNPHVDGIVFTGSKDVGMRLAKEFSTRWPKPVLMEMGGKNPAIVTESADLELAAEGVMRSAFGLQGQKCSACSRVYVDSKVAAEFTRLLVEKTRALKMGDPADKDVYFGPVINKKAMKTFLDAAEQARKDGEILIGGERLSGELFDKGTFVAPTIAKLPLNSTLFERELFVPFLSLGVVSGLDEALRESNKVEFGLTAGIFSRKQDELDRFFDEIEAGVTYSNRRTGATTGAWPGVQSFCGWKGSGSTGKGGCGPYYVAQFMREQSRTVMEAK